MKDILSAFTFNLGQDTHLFEKGNVLVCSQTGNGLNTRVNAPDTTVSQFLLHSLIIVVSIENNLPVLLEGFTSDSSWFFSCLNLVSKFSKLFSTDGVQHSVDHGHILGGPDSTEFKASSTIGEGGSTVTILSGDKERNNFTSSKVKSLLFGIILGFRSVHEGLKVVSHVLAKVCGDDGRRGLTCSKTEVISWRGDGHAHQITMFINGSNNSSHNDGEGGIIASGLNQGFRVKNIHSITSGNGPVVVLSGSIDFIERLFLEKSGKVVLCSHFFNDLHDHQILVNLGSVGSVERSKFKLVRSNLTMACLQRDTHAPALILDFLHASKGTSGSGKRGHVVITHFLATRSILSNEGTSSQLKIGAAVVVLTFNEEDFLFQTNVGDNSRASVKSEGREESGTMLVNSSIGSEKRCLFIQGSAIVGNKNRRDEDSVTAEENGGGCVNSKVSTSLVCSTKSSIGVRRTISFSLDKSLTLEVLFNLHVLVEFEHHVLDLTRLTVTDTGGSKRLEPVAVNIGSIVNGPVKDSVGHSIRMGLDPGRVVEDLLAGTVLGEVFVGDLSSKDILSKVIELAEGSHGSNANRGALPGQMAGGVCKHHLSGGHESTVFMRR
mmetsp:Transcript_29344/g.68354  ORF Transcript_29344/g.68354 Transcript_29344/m.68354 type:complete len:606 (-) Transcript_29344:53-1870(-)